MYSPVVPRHKWFSCQLIKLAYGIMKWRGFCLGRVPTTCCGCNYCEGHNRQTATYFLRVALFSSGSVKQHAAHEASTETECYYCRGW